MSALTEDIATLNLAVTSLPTLLTNCTLVLACAAYLAWLEPMASLLFLAITATAMWTTLGVVRRSRDSQRRARTQVDALFGHFRDHLHGIKELQLNAGRRRMLGADLQHTASAYARQQVSASSAMSTAVGVFQVVFMLPVGALVFTAAWSSVEAAAQVGEYVIVLLYAMAPVNAVGGLFQNLGRGAVAFGNIESLDLAFGERVAEPAASPVGQRPWRRLIVRGAVHCFRSENGQASFTLGPVDLTFDRGNVVFLVGGNGAGKTTFTKMLCGLYLPESGVVAFDEEVHDPARLEAHRREFGAVYGDYHLFAHLPESTGDVELEAGRYLRELRLAHKVTVSGGRFSTLNLSQGERKRLALVASLLEDRNVYIFDEWAADQDPVSRAYFYEVVLAALRQRGKTVFVVSHDERYFHVADRIVKFELGQVVADIRQTVSGSGGDANLDDPVGRVHRSSELVASQSLPT